MTKRAEATSHILLLRRAVLPLFFVSGATGLIYEVAWTRAFGAVFGNTVFAVSTVLTAFMLGLAGGSWLFGRLADRTSDPMRFYALLEVCIGVYAMLFPAILLATDVFYRWFFGAFQPGFYPLSLVRFVLSVLILILPTAFMGGTLPVLSKLWAVGHREQASSGRIGQSVGVLYAINTFGAVVGSFLCGYMLLRLIGVTKTICFAALANAVVGLVAFAFSRSPLPALRGLRGVHQPRKLTIRNHEGDQGRTIDAAAKTPTRRGIILLAVALAGFCALALEVLWTRVLVFVLGTTAYAFACMLTTFLFGIAVGSFVSSRFVVRRVANPVFALGVVELLIALSALASVSLLGKLWHYDNVLAGALRAKGFWVETVGHFIDASIVLLLPTLFMGAAFPIAVKGYASSWDAAGSRVGEVYASNTLGCVLGSFIAGFVLVPLIGLRSSFVVIVAALFAVSLFLILFAEKRRASFRVPVTVLASAAIVAAFVGVPPEVFVRTMNTYHYPSKIVYIRDDATGTVTVHDLPDGDRLIAVDGVDVAGMDLMLRTTQKLQGYVPLLAHRNPNKVLQIGFGSGETSGVGLGFGVEEYNIVEICPGVFEAGRFFEKINRGSYRDPRLNKIIMDGKNFVKLTDEKFDVIMNDSTYPGTTGSSALYTYDHFKECRAHLRPGGVLSSWVPLDLRLEDFQTIVKSFQEVMPHSYLWMATNCLNKHAVLLGTLDPLEMDFQRGKKLVERPDISADLSLVNIHSVYDFLDCFLVNADGLRRISRDAPLNTDDKPLLEFGAAINRDVDACWVEVLGWVAENHSPISPYITNTGDAQDVRAALDRSYNGTRHVLRALLAMLHGDPEITHIEFQAARKVNPGDGDVESCLEELRGEAKALSDAVQRMPQNSSLRWRLAQKYLLLQDYRQAAEEYRSFLKLTPNHAGGRNNLGYCHLKIGELDEAISNFKRAAALDPSTVSAYFSLGEIYGRLKDFAAASENYEKALSLNPQSQRTYLSMADTYDELGRHDESIRAMERCLSIWPNFVPAYEKLSRAYFKQNEFRLALNVIEKATALAPDDSRLQNIREVVKRAAEGAAQ